MGQNKNKTIASTNKSVNKLISHFFFQGYNGKKMDRRVSIFKQNKHAGKLNIVMSFLVFVYRLISKKVFFQFHHSHAHILQRIVNAHNFHHSQAHIPQRNSTKNCQRSQFPSFTGTYSSQKFYKELSTLIISIIHWHIFLIEILKRIVNAHNFLHSQAHIPHRNSTKNCQRS